MELDDGVELGH